MTTMPVLYTIVKYLHILLAIVAVGFNATYAIWLARGQRDPEHLDFALKGVKFLDDYVANPSYVLLLLSGLTMTWLGGYPLNRFWILAALILFVALALIGLGVYTPTLSKQIRALAAGGPQSGEYRALATRSTVVGIILAVIVAVILVMMVFKPV